VEGIETIVGLMVVVVALVTVARRTRIPYPALLVVGGLVLSFIPGLPRLQIAPDLVLLIFVPPLLEAAALFTSWRDFRSNLRPIALLAIGLIFTTIGFVALAAHTLIPGFPWVAGFVLGAVVSPPDAVAVAAITENIRLPRRIVAILEGESLVNDSTALVSYRLAVAAAMTGVFSPAEATVSFLTTAVGGVLIGLAFGWIVVALLRRIHDTPVEITIVLILAYAAYLPAEALHVSGVLAAVTSGLYLGRYSPVIMSSQTRVQERAVWDIVIFLLNGLVFILIGLHLPEVLSGLAVYSWGDLLWYGAVISATVILVRLLWVWPATYLPRLLFRGIRERDPSPPWQPVFLIGWAGMRGVVSLATALALPLTTEAGTGFPGRDLIIFLTFCVILVTLVGQALSLGPIIRWLGLSVTGGPEEEEEARARLHATQAAISHLEKWAGTTEMPPELITDLRSHYEHQAHRAHARLHGAGDRQAEEREVAHQRLRRELVAIQRGVLIDLRNQGAINDEVLHRIQHELDLEELRLSS